MGKTPIRWDPDKWVERPALARAAGLLECASPMADDTKDAGNLRPPAISGGPDTISHTGTGQGRRRGGPGSAVCVDWLGSGLTSRSRSASALPAPARRN